MSETLTRADVERIATLARLELTAEEVTLFAAQLTAILAYADQVQQVDTSGVSHGHSPQPASRGCATTCRCRRSTVTSSSARRPCADRAAGLFKVPRVIGS